MRYGLPIVLLLAALSPAAAGSDWSERFNAPSLDAVVSQAAATAPARAARAADVEAAASGIDVARASRAPTVNAGLELRGGQEQSPMTGGVADELHPLKLGLELAWNIDVFRRIGNEIGAAQFRYDAARFAEQDWLLAYESRVVAEALEQALTARELDVAESLASSSRATLVYVDSRVASGLMPERERHDPVRALREAEIAQSRAAERHALARTRWSYLVGTNVPAPDLTLADLSVPDAVPRATLPERVIMRPDVAAAHAAWRGADRAVASAEGNRLPELSAVASGSWQGPSTSEDPDEWMAWAGLRVGLPALQSDRAARVRQERARGAQAEAIYHDALRAALRDLHGAHVSQSRTTERLEAAQGASQALAAKLASATNRRAAGLISVAELETVRREALQAQLTQIRSQRDALLAAVRMIRESGSTQDRARPGPGAGLSRSMP